MHQIVRFAADPTGELTALSRPPNCFMEWGGEPSEKEGKEGNRIKIGR